MTRRTIEDQKDGLIPEDFIVRARLEKIWDDVLNWTKDGKAESAEVVKWKFRVQGGDYDGVEVEGTCDPRVTNSENNRMRLWSEAMLGRELGVGEDFDDQEFVGLFADISVKHKPGKKDDRIFMQLDSVLPASGPNPNDVPF